MSFSLTQPIVFEPIFKERVWGGRRLEAIFGKQLPPGQRIGESWEIVDRPEAQSIVRQGPLAGRSLHQLWMEERDPIFGVGLPDAPRFPILAKLLDASDKLSLQVHPPAEIAESLGGEAKSELWYFATADPGAEICAGLRPGVNRSRFEEAVQRGDVAELVHRIGVRTGDSFFVPSGRLHGIDGGNVIVEIQQNSDTTYRVFDWNRKDEKGRERALHVKESMQSIRFDDFTPQCLKPEGEELLRSPHFVVEKWELLEKRRARVSSAFALFVCLSGALRCGGMNLGPGAFFLVPACLEGAQLEPRAPSTSLLRITL
ncbi:MAG: type I phosphomannose isomerase catalytic subunit [Spartobacteria bacterium]